LIRSGGAFACTQREGLADVPALAFRLLGKLGKVDKRLNDE